MNSALLTKPSGNATFYNFQTESSRIKANIVAEYFPQYSRIIYSNLQKEIRYVDLFAGKGMYDDEKHSTPLLIAKACAQDPKLAAKVRLVFNDNKFCEELKCNFYKHFPSNTFAKEPRFGNLTVGEDDRISNFLAQDFKGKNLKPTLLFVDPWGYKGVDTLALAKFLNGWGNELFLFVNIKRVHAAIENKKFDESMQLMFPTTINELRKDRKYKSTVYERLNLIMGNLALEFKKAVKDELFHCEFKFQEDSVATSHYIIHFTKHHKGYELIKQIYYDFDNIGATLEKDGSYTFDAKTMGKSDSMLILGDTNIAALSSKLQRDFKGRTLSGKQLFEEHHTKTKYCGSHYLQTLRDMVLKGKLKASFTDTVNHRVSVLLTDTCKLEFV